MASGNNATQNLRGRLPNVQVEQPAPPEIPAAGSG
jgi:hypothetical protein